MLIFAHTFIMIFSAGLILVSTMLLGCTLLLVFTRRGPDVYAPYALASVSLSLAAMILLHFS